MMAQPADRLRLIYVAGLPRTGSTVLGKLLGTMPDTIFVGELAYFWRRFANNELCSCGRPLPSCPFWSAVVWKVYSNMTSSRAKELAEMEKLVLRRRVPARLSAGYSRQVTAMLEERAQFYSSIGEVAGASHIIDSGKDAVFGWYMAKLKNADFATVHIVRDPRGVAYSWQKQVRSDSEPADMPRRSPLKTAAQWLLQNLIVQLLLRRRSAAYARVRYEDLVTRSTDVVHNISQATFLDKDTLPDDWAQLTNDHHLVAGNPGVRRRSGNGLQLILDEEWRTQLPRRRQWLVTAICCCLMATYGYPLRAHIGAAAQ